jgi:hypothetical protein
MLFQKRFVHTEFDIYCMIDGVIYVYRIIYTIGKL